MTEQIQGLIMAACADGLLEPSEIEFLRRKAAELGDDPDEVEMYAKAGLALLKQKLAKQNTQVGASQGHNQTSDKVGSVKKCPACGAEIEAFQLKCPSCGHEFRDTKVASSIQAFFEKLDELDKKIAAEGDNEPVGGALGAMMGLDAITKMASGIGSIRKQKIDLIKNFPIPNTKEDLLEFIILASSHVETTGPSMNGNMNYMAQKREFDAFNSAWKAKINQAQSKAMIACAGDSATLNQINAITTALDAREKRAAKKRIIIIAAIVVGVVAVVGVYVGLIAGLMAPVSKETERLNAIVTEITRDIEVGNLDGAHLKASQLQWGTDYERKSYKPIWDEKREALLQEIETLQKTKK
jgi:hypothetical protein